MTQSRCFFLFFAPLACLLAGCDVVAQEDAFTWQTVQEMFRREMRKILAYSVGGSFAGSLAGFVLALVSWQVFRGLARFWHAERRDPWFSRFLGLCFLFVGTVLGGWIGMLEGGKRGVRVALNDGPIGKDFLPQAGNAGADLLVRVDQFLKTGTGSADEVLQQFRAGVWKLNVERLREKIDKLETASAKQLADFVLDKIYQENPQFKGQLQETLLSWVVPRFAESLTQDDLPTIHEDFDPKPFLNRLAESSQAQADAEGMTRKQLSQFFVDQVVVPDVFANLERQANRTQRFLTYGLGAIVAAAVLFGLVIRPFRRLRPEVTSGAA